MIPLLDELKRFLHDASSGRSFVIVAHRDLRVPTDREEATWTPQLFSKALQALNDSGRRPQQETSKIDLVRGPIDMSVKSPLY